MNVKLKPFHPYIRLAMYHTWLYDYVADRSIYDNEIIYIDKGKLSNCSAGIVHEAIVGSFSFFML